MEGNSDIAIQFIFNSKTWQLGIIETDAFDDVVVNQYEKKMHYTEYKGLDM